MCNVLDVEDKGGASITLFVPTDGSFSDLAVEAGRCGEISWEEGSGRAGQRRQGQRGENLGLGYLI
nr:hypothetical protein Itr_chr03CG05700 [Ipomoea trifida]